jgi:hypothetical protein
MEVYPFHHRNLFFNIITHLDLSFTEVRGILDYLLGQKAFEEEGGLESGRFYTFPLGGVEFEVDVMGFEVVVYRRTEMRSP